MINSIKIHVGTFSDPGTTNCDFRNPDGTERVGHAEGDEHTTVFEIDPATDTQVAWVLANGPILNQKASELHTLIVEAVTMLGLEESKAIQISTLLGGPKGDQFRIGVWPGDNRV